MTTPTFKRLGPLYKSIGMATKPELVSTRLASAQKAFKSLGADNLPALTRAALRLAKADELDFLVAQLGGDDPSFDPAGDDAEVAAVASASLWEMIERGRVLGGAAALAVVTAGFGGTRQYIDPELAGFASTTLASLQRAVRPGPSEAKYNQKPVLKEALDGLSAGGEDNDFSAGSAHLRTLIEAGVNYTEGGLKNLATQLQRVIEHQGRLEEEMNIHWWLVGGWSREADKAFTELSVERAALLAAKELAELTRTGIGLANAPALLDLVLQKGRKAAPKAVPLANLVLVVPLGERKEWAADLLENTAFASLVPLTYAGALAADSDDADDWKPRFKRLTGLESEVSLKPLQAATQLYREQLLLREVG